jgi:hypothetical protein
MLASVELHMSRSLQTASFLPRFGVNWAFVAAMLLGAGSFSLLRGQSAARTTDSGTTNPGTTTALPAAPAPIATDSTSSPNAARPIPDSNSVTAAFNLDQNPPPASSGAAGVNSREWSRSMLDPFQPGPNFGNFSSSPSGMGLNGSAGFGGSRQRAGGFSPMNGAGMGGLGLGGRQGTAGPLFPNGAGMAAGSNGFFAPASLTTPSLNQLMHGRFNLPLSSSTSSLRFVYQNALRPGGNPGELGRPSTSMMFSTSDLGNGVYFSAGTSYGHSMAGAPAAALGSNASPEGKHSGPSVALKLSF